MEEIDNKILDMTIQVAGESEANRFSTREIAAKLGISEYMIFDHFHDKDNLLNLADERVADYYYASILKWGPQSANFFEFFSHIMDDLLSVSSHGAFAINYCRVFPRYEKASDFSFSRSNVKKRSIPPPVSSPFIAQRTMPSPCGAISLGNLSAMLSSLLTAIFRILRRIAI